MKFYTPCNNLPFQSVYRVKGGTEMDGPNRLEELVNTYETTLYRAALAILGDAHEAEDAVQDAFLRCLEKAPDFESPAHARAWLLRVTEEPDTADYRDLELSVVDKHNEVLSNTE